MTCSHHKEYSTLKARRLKQKKSLKAFYRDCFYSFKLEIEHRKITEQIIELGAGSDLIKSIIPHAKVTDVIDFPGRDFYLDCTTMPLKDKSVGAFLMLNVLHHVPDKKAFFAEVHRCLKPGGILFIRDQYVGPMSRIIYKHLHREHFDENTFSWNFISTDPVNDANGAIPFLIFTRDLKIFQQTWPDLKLVSFTRVSSFLYWLSGGLKWWTLIPSGTEGMVLKLDKHLSHATHVFSSFMDLVIEKKKQN
jgi:SAM-dependent methyltransferase